MVEQSFVWSLAVSTQGLFDQVAKYMLFVVLKRAGFPQDIVIQHLGDICDAIAKENLHMLQKLDQKFFEVAKELGIKLAPHSDPDKSFSASHVGTVLGVEYNTKTWTWAIPQDKLGQAQDLAS